MFQLKVHGAYNEKNVVPGKPQAFILLSLKQKGEMLVLNMSKLCKMKDGAVIDNCSLLSWGRYSWQKPSARTRAGILTVRIHQICPDSIEDTEYGGCVCCDYMLYTRLSWDWGWDHMSQLSILQNVCKVLCGLAVGFSPLLVKHSIHSPGVRTRIPHCHQDTNLCPRVWDCEDLVCSWDKCCS